MRNRLRQLDAQSHALAVARHLAVGGADQTDALECHLRQIARSRALRRAAEVTLENGDEWFLVTTAYSDTGELAGGGSSVSIGGASSSGGRSSVGLGVGIALPMGGSSGPVEHVMEIITGSGQKPDNADAYDANDVLANLGGA